jgi:hypothetical protein
MPWESGYLTLPATESQAVSLFTTETDADFHMPQGRWATLLTSTWA